MFEPPSYSEHDLLRANALAMLGDLDQALDIYDALASNQDKVELAYLANLAGARHSLDAHRPGDARRYVDALPADEFLPADIAFMAALLRCEVLARTHGHSAQEVENALEESSPHDPSSWRPSMHIALAIARLSLYGVDREGLAPLCRALRRAETPNRRLVMVRSLARVGSPTTTPVAEHAAELLRLTPLDTPDNLRLRLARAEILRISGHAERARELLRDFLAPSEQSVFFRHARLCMDRIGWTQDLLDQPEPPDVWPDTFRQTVVAEHAERLGTPSRYPGLRGVGPLLGASPGGPDESDEAHADGNRDNSLQVEALPVFDDPMFFLGSDAPGDQEATPAARGMDPPREQRSDIVELSHVALLASIRQARGSLIREVTSLWAAHDIRVDLVDDLDAWERSSQNAEMMHLVAPMREMRDGFALPDLGFMYRDAARFARVITRSGRTGLVLLILSLPRFRTRSEVGLQIQAQNRFCAELANLARSTTILATGAPERPAEAIEFTIEWLRAGLDMRELVALRRDQADHPLEEFSFWGPNRFFHLPRPRTAT